MSLRVCAVPGCPTLVKSGRCPEHTQTTSQRGYDSKHQAERAKWAPLVKLGIIDCRRGTQCRAPNRRIQPGEPWHLGHPDAACPAPKAPEHEACNEATATHAVEAAEQPPEPRF